MSHVCTVAIPAYNRPEAVCRALESALAQDLPALQVLVVDDCSTDGAWEAVQRYTDPRLRLVRNERNLGLFANFNRCLELAEGKYVRLLCNDDRLVPGCLRTEVELMEQHPAVGLLSTRGRQVDKNYNLTGMVADEFPTGIYPGAEMISHVMWVLSHYGKNPLNYPSGILLRRETALRAGQFSSEYRLVGDVDYWLRICTLSDVIIADHVGCEAMGHSGQVSQSVLLSGQVVEELFALAQRWQVYLHRQGVDRRIMKQLTGCALWWMLVFLKQKRPDVARLYWQSAITKGYSPLTLFWETGRFIWMRKLQSRYGICYRPPLSFQPLAS